MSATYSVLIESDDKEVILEAQSKPEVNRLVSSFRGAVAVQIGGVIFQPNAARVRVFHFPNGLADARRLTLLRRDADRGSQKKTLERAVLDAGTDVTVEFHGDEAGRNPATSLAAVASDVASQTHAARLPARTADVQRSKDGTATVQEPDETGTVKGVQGWNVLVAAASRVPGGKWVFGPVALVAAAAVARALFWGNARGAVFGVVLTFAFVIAFFAFAKGASRIKVMTGPATLLIWSMTLIFIVVVVTICGCVFLGRPLDLRHWVDDRAAAKEREG